MTNGDRADKFFYGSRWADFPKDVLSALEKEYKRTLDEVEKQGAIEMRERAAKLILTWNFYQKGVTRKALSDQIHTLPVEK